MSFLTNTRKNENTELTNGLQWKWTRSERCLLNVHYNQAKVGSLRSEYKIASKLEGCTKVGLLNSIFSVNEDNTEFKDLRVCSRK